MLNHPNPFVNMVMHAFLGAILGLVGGLVLGLIIQGVNGLIITPAMGSDDGPWQVAPFLGMSFGSAIGAVLGGLFSSKK